MPSILDYFDALTGRGLKVIPLRENSKKPICRGWTDGWHKDAMRDIILRFPEANIGLMLGDIVDVEGDSEEANQIVTDLIGDYPHPLYRSTKSIHHLFVNPDPGLRRFVWNHVEFRGHGHQSVLPPSKFQGAVYQWMKTFRFPVPQMPDRLLEFYRAKSREIKLNPVKPGHLKAWCGACGKECMMHKKRFDLELKAFKLLGSKWQCQKCRPLDMRPACRMLKKGAQSHRVIVNALQPI